MPRPRPEELFPIVEEGVHILPVVHERLEFADYARNALAALQPNAVAVEIPSSLGRTWLRAVDRLPEISVLLYETRDGRHLTIGALEPHFWATLCRHFEREDFIETQFADERLGTAPKCLDLIDHDRNTVFF